MTALGDLIGSYLDHLRVERGVSPHTAAAYRRDLARYADFLAARGVDDPGKVTSALVDEFAMSLREGEPAPDGDGVAAIAAGPGERGPNRRRGAQSASVRGRGRRRRS